MADADYLSILDYLKNTRGMSYKKPETCSEPDKTKYLKMKYRGQSIVEQLQAFSNKCHDKYGLISEKKDIKWLDGSNTKLRKYLWVPMKYEKYKAQRESISLFAEVLPPDDKAVFRVSLELKNADSTQSDLDNYHHHLELPINPGSGLVYVSGSNESGTPLTLKESRDVVQQKVKNKTYKKVQICKYINPEQKNNDEIEAELLEAVGLLIPYYEHVEKISLNNMKTTQNSVSSRTDNRKETTYSSLGIPKNLILFGPPGTGKTYSTAKYAVNICDEPNSHDSKMDYQSVMNRYRELMNDHRIAFVTFHQSYGYEEFIEGIKPVIGKNDFRFQSKQDECNNDIKYEIVDGIFKKFCENARCSAIDKKPYVFIIDEINRGNISKIFGELITLIEESKRDGKEECIPAILPYSGKQFTVPDNVFIIGTMNTADRSIALMDTALRRRFSFKEMLPDYELLNKIVVNDNGYSVNIGKMLEIINERITLLFDREHTIGHAIFMELTGKECNTIDKLGKIFSEKVIPLLQEYFYEDYEKIRLILGDNAKDKNDQFISANDIPEDSFEGDISEEIDVAEKKCFKIEYEHFLNINAYIGISKKLKPVETK